MRGLWLVAALLVILPTATAETTATLFLGPAGSATISVDEATLAQDPAASRCIGIHASDGAGTWAILAACPPIDG